jgi:non-ribosomal peptide synthetase component E (peptide arylation enzyme)
MGTRLTAAAATRKQGTMYTISDIISNNARNFGRREALVAGDQRLSFIEFEQQVSHAAAALQSLGVGKGDRVLGCRRDGRVARGCGAGADQP